MNNKEIKSIDKDIMLNNSDDVKTKNEYNCETFKSFDDMNLKPPILKSIYAYGFEKPSGIQQKAIVPLAKGHDIIAQAQSGTGKTGTFAIGVLEIVDFKEDSTQALILAPTRELASQIYTVISSLSFYVENLKIQLAIGGVNGNDIPFLNKLYLYLISFSLFGICN